MEELLKKNEKGGSETPLKETIKQLQEKVL